MTNKTISNILIGTVISVFVLSVFESAFSPETLSGLYILIGLSLMVFGVWAAIILRKE